MSGKVSVLGFSGVGKTAYIVNIYNHYSKTMNDKDYFVQIDDKESKIYLDKLLRDLKLKKNINSTRANKNISLSIHDRQTEEKLSDFSVSDFVGEILWYDPELNEEYLDESDIIVFFIDSNRVFNDEAAVEEQNKKIIEILTQNRKTKSKPILFLFSKYDKILDKFPDMSFKAYSEKYLNDFVNLLDRKGFKDYELMELSSFSEVDGEIDLNRQINLTNSFNWIFNKLEVSQNKTKKFENSEFETDCGIENKGKNTKRKKRPFVIGVILILFIVVIFFVAQNVFLKKQGKDAVVSLSNQVGKIKDDEGNLEEDLFVAIVTDYREEIAERNISINVWNNIKNRITDYIENYTTYSIDAVKVSKSWSNYKDLVTDDVMTYFVVWPSLFKAHMINGIGYREYTTGEHYARVADGWYSSYNRWYLYDEALYRMGYVEIC
jgi:hypothetical protein